MILDALPDTFAVCRLEPGAAVPAWALGGSVFSITRTPDELSIVCPQDRVPSGVRAELAWRCLKVRGPLDFGLTGILASLARPLAEAGISIFAVSTFDTDYLLVKQSDLAASVSALSRSGHEVHAS